MDAGSVGLPSSFFTLRLPAARNLALLLADVGCGSSADPTVDLSRGGSRDVKAPLRVR